MAIFSVHIPPVTTGTARPDSDRVMFVADKFSWPALFFGPLWLIWHRMWWVLSGYIMAAALLPIGADLLGINDIAHAWVTLALILLFALEAPVLRRWSLARRGYALAVFLSGHDVEDCEVKFFGTWAPAKTVKPRPEPGPHQAGPNMTETGVIGVFPTPGARK